MAKKKNGLVTYALIAGAVVAAVFLIRKMNKDKKRGLRSSVTADSPIVQSEDVFMTEREQTVATSPLDTVTDIFKKVFPKKTAEEKAARKTKVAERKKVRLATRATKRTKKPNVGFVESVLY